MLREVSNKTPIEGGGDYRDEEDAGFGLLTLRLFFYFKCTYYLLTDCLTCKQYI